MQSFDDMLLRSSPEEIELMLKKIRERQALLASEEQSLQSQSEAKISSRVELASNTAPMSNVGPFSIVQSNPRTLTINEIDLDDCRNFLHDYLGQGQKYGTRRGSVSNAELIVNGQSRSINLNLSSKISVNATVTYDSKSKNLHFEVIQGKSKKDKTRLLGIHLEEQLVSFFNNTYAASESFKSRLYAEGKIVDFEETEFSNNLSQSVATVSSVTGVAVSTEEQLAIENILGTGKADSSERKRAGSGSTDSEPQMGSIVDANFFVKTMVNPKTAGLSFAVSPLRPDTYLGRQQGAHITAYIVFVTAILETVDEQSISDIPDLLVAAAMQFVPSSQWDSFQNTLRELIKDNPFFEKKERKQLTAGLRDTIQETTVQFIKKSVKIHYAVVLAHFIDDLSNQILMAINQSESTLYARAGRPKTRQELGQEGSRIRNAMKELRKISTKLSAEPVPSLIERFSVFSVADADEVTGSLDENRVATLHYNMRKRAPNSTASSADLSDTIAEHIFTLFDFDYYEYTSSAILSKIESTVLEEMKDLEKSLPKARKGKHLTEKQIIERSEITDKIHACKEILEILGEIEKMETPEERWGALRDVQESNAHTLNVLFGKIKKRSAVAQINEVMRDIKGKAPEIIVQHLDIIMNYAFSGLHNLTKTEWDIVCEKFINLIESNLHWSNAPDVISEARILQPKHLSDANAQGKTDEVSSDYLGKLGL